jgi:hypothetical protein
VEPYGPLSRRDRSRRPLTRRAPSSNSGGAGNYEDRIGSPVYEVPRDQLTRERVSPASSSGFSSGSDYQETSGGGGRVECKQTAAVKSADTKKYSAAVPEARLAAAASRESVLAELEWDDAGIELNEDVMARAGQFWLENSILRYCGINMNVVF